jgi:uncharacterized protein VirK/YbjX
MGESLVPDCLYLGRPYLARSFNEAEKNRCRFFNASFVVSAFRGRLINRFLSRGIWLYDDEIDGASIRIVLCVTPDQKHEGELSAAFFLDGRALYILGFNFIPGSVVGLPDPETILIVRMQGSQGVYAEIREATKALSDVSPQVALLAAIDGVAQALGLRHVVGVSGENCLGRKDELPLEPFLKSYDEFFLRPWRRRPIGRPPPVSRSLSKEAARRRQAWPPVADQEEARDQGAYHRRRSPRDDGGDGSGFCL